MSGSDNPTRDPADNFDDRPQSATPRIAIITPTYNRRVPLLRAIESVRSQTYGDFEHIIVDDGSTDGTEEAVASLDDPRIVYIKLPGRSGANAARNAALRRVRAPITTFLDSDDRYLPDRLEWTLSISRDVERPFILISSFETERDGRTISNLNPSLTLSPEQLRTAVAAQLIYMACTSITASTSALRAIDGFDALLPRFQDGDLLMRLAQTHGATLSDRVTWIKSTSDDAITTTQAAVSSYALLSRRNPEYRQNFPVILGYMVARAILSDLLRGRFVAAWRGLSESRKSPLSFSFPALVKAYVAGKRLRKTLRSELLDGI